MSLCPSPAGRLFHTKLLYEWFLNKWYDKATERQCVIQTGTINDRARLDVSSVCLHGAKSFYSKVVHVRLNSSHRAFLYHLHADIRWS